MKAEVLLKYFDRMSDAPDALLRLKQFILDLGVRGELVEQDRNDEPAHMLLARLINRGGPDNGQRRKSENLPAITSRDIPFALPSGWAWERLGNVGETNIGLTYSPQDVSDVGIPVLRSSNIQNGKLDFDDLVRVKSEPKPSVMVKDGDLLICARNGSRALVGKVALIENLKEPAAFGAFMAIFRSEMNRYLYYFICSSLFRQLISEVNTTTINQITQSNLRSTLAPIPPLAEQHRIVARVKELMALCDQLEDRQHEGEIRRDRLSKAALHNLNNPENAEALHLHARFYLDHLPCLTTRVAHIKQLRQTIYNLAFRGKLVPQDPNDEPARELFKRIQTSEELRKKKIKRKRRDALHPSDSSREPFELPIGWTWARFPELGLFERGKSKHRPRNDQSLFQGGTHPFVQTGDVARSNGLIKTFTNKYNELGLAQSVKWPTGTLCITIAANIADSGILTFDACFPDSVVGFIPSAVFPNARYFEYFIRTAKANLLEFAPATAQKNINLEILNAVLIPLPPLPEQHRIVARVDELMALCDHLENQLATAQNENRNLLEAVLYHALETD